MDDLPRLADLIRQRNQLEQEITTLIQRPAQIGHMGEYIASRIFDIVLEPSAAHKVFDGRFTAGTLQGRTVNIKWYARCEGLLDINSRDIPDYFLVLAGPKTPAESSRGKTRPWLIDYVYLFDVPQLVRQLQGSGVRIGHATSVRQHTWNEAELYPHQRNALTILSDAQRSMLELFSSMTQPK